MSMEENILLPQAYHTRRRIRELRDEAALLAGRLGFPGLPRSAPRELNHSDLQMAACVRAFLGRPALVILEDPTVGADAGLLSKLINLIGDFRSQGTAVLWLTLENSIWQDSKLPVSRRLRAAGQQINEVTW
jgi:phospholipid/cholesterol/gamma-HCH transport system ATP-binding protein